MIRRYSTNRWTSRRPQVGAGTVDVRSPTRRRTVDGTPPTGLGLIGSSLVVGSENAVEVGVEHDRDSRRFVVDGEVQWCSKDDCLLPAEPQPGREGKLWCWDHATF